MNLRVAIGPVVVVTLLAASCRSSGSSGALTLYSGQHDRTTQALVSAFTKATGIKVDIRSGDETQLSDQIVQEATNTRADVFYSENSPALMSLDEKRLFVPVDATTLAKTPAKYNPSDGGWVAVSGRVSALVYNTKALRPDQLPTSVLDLQSPAWKGKVGIATDDTDFHPVLSSVAQFESQQVAIIWLNALRANAGDKSYPTNEALVHAVDQGSVALGIINTYDWYRLRHDQASINSAVSLVRPLDPGYVFDISGAGVLRSSKHQAAAQKLVAFLAGPEGGQVLAHSASFEYPLATGVPADPQLPPLASLQPAKVTSDDLGDGGLPRKLLEKAKAA